MVFQYADRRSKKEFNRGLIKLSAVVECGEIKLSAVFSATRQKSLRTWENPTGAEEACGRYISWALRAAKEEHEDPVTSLLPQSGLSLTWTPECYSTYLKVIQPHFSKQWGSGTAAADCRSINGSSLI
jgi:hypothetical protein